MMLTWAFLPCFTYAQKIIPLVLGSGYRADTVIVLVNRDTVFNDVVISSAVTGFAREIRLPREKGKKLTVDFVINGFTTFTIVIDPKMLKRHSMIVVNAYPAKKLPIIGHLEIEIVSYKKRFFY